MALYSIRNERQFCELPDLLSRGFLGAAPDAAAHPLAAAAPGAIPRSTSAVSGVPTRPHYSATDPDARLARKGPGREAKLSLAGRVLMENRTGLVVDVEMTSPAVTLSGEAALKMLRRYRSGQRRLTGGRDKDFDTRDFVTACRELNVTPHVAQNQSRRRSAIDCRTVSHLGYLASQTVRKRVEEIFGWWRTVAGSRKPRYVGLKRN